MDMRTYLRKINVCSSKYKKTHFIFSVASLIGLIGAIVCSFFLIEDTFRFYLNSIKDFFNFLTADFKLLISTVICAGLLIYFIFNLIFSLIDKKKTKFKILDVFVTVIVFLNLLIFVRGTEEFNILSYLSNGVFGILLFVSALICLVFALFYSFDRLFARNRNLIVSIIIKDVPNELVLADEANSDSVTRALYFRKKVFKIKCNEKSPLCEATIKKAISDINGLINSTININNPKIAINYRYLKNVYRRELVKSSDYNIVKKLNKNSIEINLERAVS